MQRQRLLARVFACGFLFSGIAVAQVTTGTIAGTVKDATGAVVPAVTITIKNIDTGL